MTTSLQKGVEGGKVKFLLQGKHFFFTYPQCNLPMDCCLEQLQKEFDIQEYIVAQEEHKDLGLHLHVYFNVPKRMSLTRLTRMHLVSADGTKTFKGNYQRCKNSFAAQKYCKKDGNFITNMKFNLLAQAIVTAKGGDARAAFEMVADARPDMIITAGSRVKANLQMLALDNEPIKKGYTDFINVPAKVAHWRRGEHALWLYGASGLGKTEFAKSLFVNPLIVSHPDQMKSLEGHDCLIFDDFHMTHWPRTACIHIADLKNPRGMNVKHGCITIPAGFPRVFCSNEWIWATDNKGAIERRVFCIKITKPLFKTSSQERATHVKSQDDWDEIAQETGNGPMMVDFSDGPWPGN